MPLDLVDGRREGVIIAIYGIGGLLFRRDGHNVRPLDIQRAQILAHLRVVRDGLGNDIGSAHKRFLDGRDALFGVHIVRRRLLGRGAVGLLRVQKLGKRGKPLLAGDRSAGAPLLLIGTIDILHLGKRLCFVDGCGELGRKFPLIFNGIFDFLPPRLQIAQICQTVCKRADGLIVHRAVHLLAVTRNEGNSVALVQKGDDVLHIVLSLSEFLGENFGDRLHILSPYRLSGT